MPVSLLLTSSSALKKAVETEAHPPSKPTLDMPPSTLGRTPSLAPSLPAIVCVEEDEACLLCDKKIDAKIMPCGHAILCKMHAHTAKRCPTCRVRHTCTHTHMSVHTHIHNTPTYTHTHTHTHTHTDTHTLTPMLCSLMSRAPSILWAT